MLLGDVSIFFVVAAVPILGALTFVALLVAIVTRVFRMTWWALGGSRRMRARGTAIRAWDPVCAQPRCGYVNRPSARFCARCGNPLNRGREIDDYG